LEAAAAFVRLLPSGTGPDPALESRFREWDADFSAAVRRHAVNCKTWE